MARDLLINHIIRIENRVNEVYDRVASVQADVKNLKWRVSAISSAIGAAVTMVGTWLSKHANVF